MHLGVILAVVDFVSYASKTERLKNLLIVIVSVNSKLKGRAIFDPA